MDFRFESQERHNGQPTQPPNEVWSHVPSRRSIMGCTERAGGAQINRRADKPTESAFDIALRRQRQGAGTKVIVREPPAGGLGERCRKGLAVVLVEGLSLAHKCV